MGYDLDVPMFVIQGEQDLFTPTGPAVAYFEGVEAPLKELVMGERRANWIALCPRRERSRQLHWQRDSNI